MSSANFIENLCPARNFTENIGHVALESNATYSLI